MLFLKKPQAFHQSQIKITRLKNINLKEMVQQIVNIKIKTSLKSSIIVWNLDICCPKSYYLFNATFAIKVQTKRIIAKKSHTKEFKPQKIKLANNKTFVLPYSKEFV